MENQLQTVYNLSQEQTAIINEAFNDAFELVVKNHPAFQDLRDHPKLAFKISYLILPQAQIFHKEVPQDGADTTTDGDASEQSSV